MGDFSSRPGASHASERTSKEKMRMNESAYERREFLTMLGLGTLSAITGGCRLNSVSKTHKRGAKLPNILFIIADDLGWADVGYHGSQIMTPNIDRLARTGVPLEQHYVQPMCTPTRTALLTGRYPSRYGDHAIKPCNTQVLPYGTTTLASALNSIGYDTGLSGKWHLGSRPEWGPTKFGFNRSYGCLAGGVGQYNHLYKKGPYSRTWHRNEKYVDEQGHSTDLIAREAVRWIEDVAEPFFIYVAFTAVHVPVEVPPKWLDRYKGKTFYDDPEKAESFKRYAAYTTHMDHAIGQMLDALEQTGRRSDTLIVFVSDNGATHAWKPSGKYPGTYKPCPVLGSNLPYRGRKGRLYEGGIRVPAVANWPGKLAPRTVDSPVHIVDWMPTFARLAGYYPSQNLKWDGRDIWPLLSGGISKPQPRTLYFKFTDGRYALRSGDFKLIIDQNRQTTELYDIAADPYETKNLAQNHPEKVAELKVLLAENQKHDATKRQLQEQLTAER